MHWFDRLTLAAAPRWTARRFAWRARAALLARHYEGAASTYRTQTWNRSGTDPNAAGGPALARLREVARDLARNNPYAVAAVNTLTDHTVGWGLVGKPAKAVPAALRNVALDRWQRWADTTACDADGRNDLAGLQKLVLRTVVESGEALVRRRWRRPQDRLPIPLQLQILEPDYLDTSKDLVGTTDSGQVVRRIVQGVEFDAIGRRAAYWLLPEHPGATSSVGVGSRVMTSQRIPAEEILHIYRGTRPGQVRGISWFAPVILRLKDFDQYEDAALMKQKVAACLAVLTTDPEGTSPALGETTTTSPEQDILAPGMIANIPPGREITVVDPPSVDEHDAYSKTVLRAIASGLGVNYEDITGDYSNMPFSAARMSRLRHWARIEDARWQMLVPQFLDPVWAWAMEAATVGSYDAMGRPLPGVDLMGVGVRWTAPPPAMINPAEEGLAYQRNIRTGIMTLSEAIRERGYDPEELFAEMQSDWAILDRLGLVLDSDPRKMTQAGQAQAAAPAPAAAGPLPGAANGTGRSYRREDT